MTPAGGHERTMSQVMADMHWTTPEPVKVDDNNGIEQSFSGTVKLKWRNRYLSV